MSSVHIRRHRRRRRGFTLLEIMLVVGILAMLALFVVPALTGTQDKIKKDTARAMVGPRGEIGQALGRYKLSMGNYPEKLIHLLERPDDVEEDDERWYKFIEDTDFKDPWGQELIYTFPGEVMEDGYDLVSKGPDLKEGTEDDIANYRKEK